MALEYLAEKLKLGQTGKMVAEAATMGLSVFLGDTLGWTKQTNFVVKFTESMGIALLSTVVFQGGQFAPIPRARFRAPPDLSDKEVIYLVELTNMNPKFTS